MHTKRKNISSTICHLLQYLLFLLTSIYSTSKTSSSPFTIFVSPPPFNLFPLFCVHCLQFVLLFSPPHSVACNYLIILSLSLSLALSLMQFLNCLDDGRTLYAFSITYWTRSHGHSPAVQQSEKRLY